MISKRIPADKNNEIMVQTGCPCQVYANMYEPDACTFIYSKTCVERPLMGPRCCGLYRQVVLV